MKIVPKVWGREEWIVNTDKYCGKLLHLKKNHFGSYHYHKNKDETFFILEGEVKLLLEGKEIILKKGDNIRLEPKTKHKFEGLKDSIIIEFSTHHEDSDTIRLTESGKI